MDDYYFAIHNSAVVEPQPFYRIIFNKNDNVGYYFIPHYMVTKQFYLNGTYISVITINSGDLDNEQSDLIEKNKMDKIDD